MEHVKETTENELSDAEGVGSTDLFSLFIGGQADGERISVSEHMPYVRIPCQDGGIHEYRSERLGTSSKTWMIYVWDQITIEEAMDLLILNYKENA